MNNCVIHPRCQPGSGVGGDLWTAVQKRFKATGLTAYTYTVLYVRDVSIATN